MTTDLLRGATEEQKAAITHRDGAALVIAVPGAGKCVVGDTLVPTPRGLLRIDSIPAHFRVGADGTCEVPLLGASEQLDGIETAQSSHWLDLGTEDVIHATTEAGYRLGGTYEHPVVILTKDGCLAFRRLDQLRQGDYVALLKGKYDWVQNTQHAITPDEAYVLGLLVGDGTFAKDAGTFGLCRNNDDIVAEYRRILEDRFDSVTITPYPKKGTNSVTHSISSGRIKNWLMQCGLPMTTSPKRYVPSQIMRGSRDHVIGFLQGLFDTEASVSDHNVEYTTASQRLAREVQTILLHLGIRASLQQKKVAAYPDNTYWRMNISGIALRRLAAIKIFRHEAKKRRDLDRVAANPMNPNKEVIPYQGERLKTIRNRHFRGASCWDGRRSALIDEEGLFRLVRYFNNTRKLTPFSAERILAQVPDGDPEGDYLRFLVDNFIFDPVDKVVETGPEPVYDFTVPGNHSFVSNGFVSHNTRVITHRIAWLIEQGVDPRGIVGITFTNKAADEMKERVVALMQNRAARAVHLSTFHSFCVRMMRSWPASPGFDPKFGIADPDDQKQLILRAMANVTGRDLKLMTRLKGTDSWSYLQRRISGYKDLLQGPADVVVETDEDGKEKREDRFCKRVYAEYQKLLDRASLFDFDDLIMRAALALRHNANLRQHYGRVMTHIMVDEFQDTNYAQVELVRYLGEAHQNVFVVGDDDQSIYRFRGADPRNLTQFQSAFDAVKLYTLQTNFRSRPAITDFANAVIRRNRRLVDKTIVAHKDGGVKPRLVAARDPKDEAGWIALDIENRVRAGKFEFQDAAVIYRTKFLSRNVEEALVARGIPYKVVGAQSFFNRKPIKTILAYLRLTLNQHDDIAFGKVCNFPPRGFGDTSFAKFCAYAEKTEEALLPALQKLDATEHLSSKAATGAKNFLDIIRELQGMSAAAVGPLVEKAINLSGYRKYAERYDEEYREDVLSLLAELETAAAQFDKNVGKGATGFLEHAALMQSDTKEDENPNRVKLMTAHAAKGLEFPLVYLIGVTEGGFPLNYRNDENVIPSEEEIRSHFEEERRVFFVAATRAEERLTILWPRIQFYKGSTFDCEPSRFIHEAGDTIEGAEEEPDGCTVGAFQQYGKRTRREARAEPAVKKPIVRGPVRRKKPKFKIPDGGADAIIKERLKR